jgi:hypothetical protein
MQHRSPRGPHTPPQAPVGHGGFAYAAPPVAAPVGALVSSAFVGSKLLSSFKLPKFDGVSKNWKTWDRAFQRFLGLHQLDHVLEDGFLDTIWNVPGAKEANKLVYFLLEDSVAVGSLASKYIRQATKWNGHEAYVLLHNGYVFSGPQSATILLAELSQLRLKRDENASLFCMRLVELIEDLEAIPGDSAVYLVTCSQRFGMRPVCSLYIPSFSQSSCVDWSPLIRPAGNYTSGARQFGRTNFLILALARH